jgi:hypothetical protein
MSIQKCLITLLTLLLIACSEEKKPTEFIWYEEARQDDGSIVLVKKIEKSYSVSRKEPGAENYGYRLPRIEITDPKTGQPITWYPANLPHLLPYALHVHEGVPYVFATFYLTGSYLQWGCPIPPYIVFRWEGDKWKRIPLTALPKQFKRRNLLLAAADQIDIESDQFKGWKSIEHGDLVKAESIEKFVRGISGGALRRPSSRLVQP